MSLQCKAIYNQIVWKGIVLLIQVISFLKPLILRSLGKKHLKIGRIMLPRKKKKGM